MKKLNGCPSCAMSPAIVSTPSVAAAGEQRSAIRADRHDARHRGQTLDQRSDTTCALRAFSYGDGRARDERDDVLGA